MDSTYAPQSPDLSSFLSSPPKTQQPYNTSTQGYAPRSPGLPSFTAPLQSLQQQQQQQQQQQLPPAPPNLHTYSQNQNQLVFSDGANEFAEYGSAQYMPPIPSLPPAHAFSNQPQSQSQSQSQFHNFNLAQGGEAPYFQGGPPPHQARNDNPTYSDDYSPDHEPYSTSPAMSSRGPRIKTDSSSANPLLSAPAYKDPNPNNIEIKTKFPVARIKRIMQADDEVGKVAQVTPVAVSKALELFMIALVGGAAEKAKEKGGKKVTAQHLKSVVLGSPEQFDFLAEIVGRVSEAQEGAGGEGKKRKEKVEASDSSEEEKKPKKGRGRKKKSDE